jgi:hypothetical protein
MKKSAYTYAYRFTYEYKGMRQEEFHATSEKANEQRNYMKDLSTTLVTYSNVSEVTAIIIWK